jgi:hypothetical protein
MEQASMICKRKKRRFIALIAAFAFSGCAATPPAPGQTVTLTGKLVLKGSAPMIRPTLQVDEGNHWDLTAVDRATAIALQNRRVTVVGKVTPAGTEPTLLRSLRVTALKPAD